MRQAEVRLPIHFFIEPNLKASWFAKLVPSIKDNNFDGLKTLFPKSSILNHQKAKEIAEKDFYSIYVPVDASESVYARARALREYCNKLTQLVQYFLKQKLEITLNLCGTGLGGKACFDLVDHLFATQSAAKLTINVLSVDPKTSSLDQAKMSSLNVRSTQLKNVCQIYFTHNPSDQLGKLVYPRLPKGCNVEQLFVWNGKNKSSGQGFGVQSNVKRKSVKDNEKLQKDSSDPVLQKMKNFLGQMGVKFEDQEGALDSSDSKSSMEQVYARRQVFDPQSQKMFFQFGDQPLKKGETVSIDQGNKSKQPVTLVRAGTSRTAIPLYAASVCALFLGGGLLAVQLGVASAALAAAVSPAFAALWPVFLGVGAGVLLLAAHQQCGFFDLPRLRGDEQKQTIMATVVVA